MPPGDSDSRLALVRPVVRLLGQHLSFRGEPFPRPRGLQVLVKNIGSLHAFLKEPQVDIIPVTLRTAEIYSEFLLHLQTQGTPISTNDIWIAAMAHECSGELATRDGHFTALPMVAIAKE